MIELQKTSYLDHTIRTEPLHGDAFTDEQGGHKFIITCYQHGEKVNLTGTISGRFMRPGGTVALTGSVSDGQAIITLSSECYERNGGFLLTVFNTVGNDKFVIYACTGNVRRSKSDPLIDGGEIIDSVEDLISDIQTATAQIPVNYNASFAPAYTTKAYAVGDYVTNNGNLYRCTTVITSGETFDPTHWTQVALGNDVADIKSTLSVTSRQMANEEVPISQWIVGKYWNMSGELQTERHNICSADYIPVQKDTPYILTLDEGYKCTFRVYNGDQVTSKNYNSSGTFTVTFVYDNVKMNLTNSVADRATIDSVNHYTLTPQNTVTKKIDDLNTLIDGVDNKIDSVIDYNGIAILHDYSDGYIDCSTIEVEKDTVVSENTYEHIIVPCSGGDVFVIKGVGSNSAKKWCFIQADGTRLAYSSGTVVSNAETIVAPENSGYLIANSKKSNDHVIYRVFPSFTEDSIKKLNDDAINGTGIQRLTMFSEGYIATDGSSVNIQSIQTNPSFTCITDSCTAGDIYFVKGRGGVSAGLWAFVNGTAKITGINENYNTRNAFVRIVAPQNATHLVINVYADTEYAVYKISMPTLTAGGLTRSDLVYGRLVPSTFEYVFTTSFLTTRDFVANDITNFAIASPNIKVGVAVYNKDGTRNSSNAWLTNGAIYRMNHAQYDYKLWMAYTDESTIFDTQEFETGIVMGKRQSESEDEIQLANEQMLIARATEGYIQTLKRSLPYNIAFANSAYPLQMKSYVGNNQNVHPKVLYIDNGFAGHKYWMAYTPYPFAASKFENPCVAYSDDGYKWENISANPLSVADGTNYNSDTHLVYRADTSTLECWYRYVPGTGEVIKRRTTTDGVTWTAEETLYTNTNNSSQLLSPAIIFDGTQYCIWCVNDTVGAKRIDYYTTPNGSNWTFVRSITLAYTSNGTTLTPWHLDVIYDNGTYILCVMARNGKNVGDLWQLFLSTSTDNVDYTTPYVVLKGTVGWDTYIYRSTIVHINTLYRIYYSACGYPVGNTMPGYAVYGMGITESNTLDEFIGIECAETSPQAFYLT